MKLRATATMILCAVLSTGLRAQLTPPTPAQMAQREVQQYSSLLTLTSEQQEQALTIFTAAATTTEPLQTSERTLHQTLEAAIAADNASVISQTAASLGQISGEITAARALADAKFYQLLTAEQQTRFTALKNTPVHGGPGGGGPGGGGPGGPSL